MSDMVRWSDGDSMKKTCSHCKQDGPPEWFILYMKKFKRELLHELKSSQDISSVSCNNAIHSTVKKEKKPTSTESGRYGNVLVPITKQKMSAVDASHEAYTRKLKLYEKLHNELLRYKITGRLEKTEFDEEQALKEAPLKPKLGKTRVGASEIKNPKSIFFYKNNYSVSPELEFVLSMHLINNGTVCWSSPRLEFFDMKGIFPEDIPVVLPSLRPRESCFVTVGGRVSQKAGFHYFTCRAFEGREPFGPKFICWAKVEWLDSAGKSFGFSMGSKEPGSDGAADEGRDPVGAPIDLEVSANSQKKIEENIIEIQRRLRDIDLLRSPTAVEPNVGDGDKRIGGNGETPKTGCDLDVKEKSLTVRLEEDRVPFGIDCLNPNPTVNGACSSKIEEREKKNVDGFENIKNDAVDSDPDTDGDMSVIFVSEEEDREEENFIVIPSKTPSPANSVKEDTIFPERENKASNERPEVTKAKNVEEKKETEQQRQEVVESRFSVPTRSRRSPCGEDIFKPKKIKSKSTEYHFTTENLTHSTFSPIPEGVLEKRPLTFKFTAGKEKTPEDGSEERKDRRENAQLPRKVPKTDALGRVIYAVNSNGCCLPMEEVLMQGHGPGDGGGRSADGPSPWTRDQDKRSERFNEIPAVSILPNALMNGASNVASMAFNTARSVINNLQSAFVSEGKTEMGHPAEDTKESVSTEGLNRLFEMGFVNHHLNRELLQRHSNDLAAAVEELIRLQEKSKREAFQ